jgi:hypothetical protein
MRFMMLVKASKDSEAGVLPTKEMIDKMGTYNDQLIKAGVMISGDGLHATAKGFKVRFGDGGKITVLDGPFTETKELLAGYWIIQVKSREEAIEWAKRVPFEPGEELEVRQIFELEDFAEGTISPEIAAQENSWREREKAAAPKA